MKRNLVAMMAVVAAAATTEAAFGQVRNGRPPVAAYDNDDRRPGYRDAGNNDNGYDYDYDYDDRGYSAPAPPPPASVYAYGGGSYRRAPMPGPGFVWVDGFWAFNRGRYVWIDGFWARPPYGGARWMAPRYSGGRFFGGFWSAPGRSRVGFGFSFGGSRDRNWDRRFDRHPGYRR